MHAGAHGRGVYTLDMICQDAFVSLSISNHDRDSRCAHGEQAAPTRASESGSVSLAAAPRPAMAGGLPQASLIATAYGVPYVAIDRDLYRLSYRSYAAAWRGGAPAGGLWASLWRATGSVRLWRHRSRSRRPPDSLRTPRSDQRAPVGGVNTTHAQRCSTGCPSLPLALRLGRAWRGSSKVRLARSTCARPRRVDLISAHHDSMKLTF